MTLELLTTIGRFLRRLVEEPVVVTAAVDATILRDNLRNALVPVSVTAVVVAVITLDAVAFVRVTDVPVNVTACVDAMTLRDICRLTDEPASVTAADVTVIEYAADASKIALSNIAPSNIAMVSNPFRRRFY